MAVVCLLWSPSPLPFAEPKVKLPPGSCAHWHHGCSDQKWENLMKKDAKFEDLFQEELEDLYDAEKQIVAALPKMIAASSSEELSAALTSHLEETKQQVTRLETIFESTSQEPGGRQCKGMQGLLAEGEKTVSELERSPVLDVAIIGAARRVEHYEIVAYNALNGLAEVLGRQDACELLQE